MNTEFSDLLLKEMTSNSAIKVLVTDTGFGVLDWVRTTYPTRFYNVGSADQLLVGVAIGMSNEGVIPVCYSTSSLRYPLEMLANTTTPIKLVSQGPVDLPNIKVYKPTTTTELKSMWQEFISINEPAYLNLDY